ncbi:MAG: HupE/UreJ family protein [Pseudomonadota bacterium]
MPVVRLFVALALLAVAGGAFGHPEDEVCDPAAPPNAFCLAMLEGISEPPPLRDVIRDYLVLGFTHIIPKGLDHILFVLALFLGSTGWRSLVALVTMFTIAHSITLALVALAIWIPDGAWVEPLIATSISVVALENLLLKGDRKNLWRYPIVLVFGLLHGLGFGGVLSELGLPDGQLVPALLAFNVGVEVGQIALVAAAALIGWALVRRLAGAGRYRRWVVLPASITIGLTGAVWTTQRLL